MPLVIKIALAILFFVCLLDMPYGFYQMVRFVGLIGFAILAFKANQQGKQTGRHTQQKRGEAGKQQVENTLHHRTSHKQDNFKNRHPTVTSARRSGAAGGLAKPSRDPTRREGFGLSAMRSIPGPGTFKRASRHWRPARRLGYRQPPHRHETKKSAPCALVHNRRLSLRKTLDAEVEATLHLRQVQTRKPRSRGTKYGLSEAL